MTAVDDHLRVRTGVTTVRRGSTVDPASVVYLAGSCWDDGDGTDRRLVTALARARPVLWVDPPRSVLCRRRAGAGGPSVAPGVTRVTVVGPPGSSRPFGRQLTRLLLRRRVRRATRAWPGGVGAVVTAAPHGVLGRLEARRRVVLVHADVEVGTQPSRRSVRAHDRAVAADLAAADVVVAVSPVVAERFAERFAGSGLPFEVLPDGCDVPVDGPVETRPVEVPFDGPVVGLVGPLDERLDLAVLQRLRAARIPVLVVGPLATRDRRLRQRLLSWLYSDLVHWVAACDATDLGRHLAAMSVGIAPYRSPASHHGPFPLSSLDFLAAGIPVVTTPQPATGRLDSPLVVPADADGFADALRAVLAGRDDATAVACRDLAARHGWTARAERVAELCDAASPGAR